MNAYHPRACIAPEFKLYDRMGGSEFLERHHRTTPMPAYITTVRTNRMAAGNRVGDAVAEITQRGLDIAPDYETYMKIGMALAHEFGEAGRELFHTVCRPSPKYRPKEADHQFTACLRAGRGDISIGTFFHLYRLAVGE